MVINKSQGTVKKVGRVAIEMFKGHIRLRWTFDKKGKSLQICPEVTKDSLKIATAKAKEIDTALAKSKLGIMIISCWELLKFIKR